jgi:hypothetical protein
MRLLSRRTEDYLKGQVRCGMLEEIIMRHLMELVLFNLQTYDTEFESVILQGEEERGQ